MDRTLMKLIVHGNFSVEALEEGLRFWFDRASLDWVVSMGDYNQLLPALFQADGLLQASDAKLLVFSPDGLEGIADSSSGSGLNIDAVIERVKHVQTTSKAPVCVAITHARKAKGLEASLIRAFDAVEGLEIIAPKHIEAAFGALDLDQLVGSSDADIPFAREYWAILAGLVARRFHRRWVPARKALVLDCDNTLWQGVLGEDGINGITQDTCHRNLIGKARQLLDQGWVLCLASKNEHADVQHVFEQRDFGLNWTEFAACRINWDDKPGNLKAMAQELNLGLDAFVFVDDNPLECELMRTALPQVATLHFDPNAPVDWLDQVWAFDGSGAVTNEDQSRTAFYQSGQQRAALQNQFASNADYLQALQMQLTVGVAEPSQFARVAQLSQRTNQFNVSGARLEPAEVAQLAQAHVVLQASLSDRFGDYGLVGAVLADSRADSLRVVGFYLSCRAFGRGVEHQLLQQLAQYAIEQRVEQLVFDLKLLPRNLPALRFIARLTGQQVEQLQEGPIHCSATQARRFEFDPQVSLAAGDETAQGNSTEGFIAPNYQAIATLRTAAEILAQIDAETRSRPDLATPFVAPRQGLQQRLARLWRATLRLDQVGVNDEFDDLGGRSIQLVGLHRRIVDELGFPIALMDLFRFTTISKLASFLQQDTAQQQLSEAAQRSKKMRYSLAQFRPARRHF